MHPLQGTNRFTFMTCCVLSLAITHLFIALTGCVKRPTGRLESHGGTSATPAMPISEVASTTLLRQFCSADEVKSHPHFSASNSKQKTARRAQLLNDIHNLTQTHISRLDAGLIPFRAIDPHGDQWAGQLGSADQCLARNPASSSLLAETRESGKTNDRLEKTEALLRQTSQHWWPPFLDQLMGQVYEYHFIQIYLKRVGALATSSSKPAESLLHVPLYSNRIDALEWGFPSERLAAIQATFPVLERNQPLDKIGPLTLPQIPKFANLANLLFVRGFLDQRTLPVNWVQTIKTSIDTEILPLIEALQGHIQKGEITVPKAWSHQFTPAELSQMPDAKKKQAESWNVRLEGLSQKDKQRIFAWRLFVSDHLREFIASKVTRLKRHKELRDALLQSARDWQKELKKSSQELCTQREAALLGDALKPASQWQDTVESLQGMLVLYLQHQGISEDEKYAALGTYCQNWGRSLQALTPSVFSATSGAALVAGISSEQLTPVLVPAAAALGGVAGLMKGLRSTQQHALNASLFSTPAPLRSLQRAESLFQVASSPLAAYWLNHLGFTLAAHGSWQNLLPVFQDKTALATYGSMWVGELIGVRRFLLSGVNPINRALIISTVANHFKALAFAHAAASHAGGISLFRELGATLFVGWIVNEALQGFEHSALNVPYDEKLFRFQLMLETGPNLLLNMAYLSFSAFSEWSATHVHPSLGVTLGTVTLLAHRWIITNYGATAMAHLVSHPDGSVIDALTSVTPDDFQLRPAKETSTHSKDLPPDFSKHISPADMKAFQKIISDLHSHGDGHLNDLLQLTADLQADLSAFQPKERKR